MLIVLSDYNIPATMEEQSAKVAEELMELIEAHQRFIQAQEGDTDHLAEEGFDLIEATVRYLRRQGVDIPAANIRHLKKMHYRHSGIT